VHKLVAQKPDDGADQNCLSVVAAAEQDHDEGDDPAGLNQVPDQLVPVPHHGLQNLFCTNCLISRSDLGLVMQDHVQQGIMNFQFSVVFDEAQFAEFVHEKAHPRSGRADHRPASLWIAKD
jgi:hypothetical protein